MLGEPSNELRLVALDIDGTITVDKKVGEFRLELDAIKAIRKLEEIGVKVSFVTGNSVPVVAGLARYVGASGPQVAENGCVVFYKDKVYRVCRYSTRTVAELLLREFSNYLRPSWQNRYRIFDYALVLVQKVDVDELIDTINLYLKQLGVRVKISYSGYAIHVRPIDADKGRGLKVALSLAGVEPNQVIAIGDSEIDTEMKKIGVRLVAVGNSDKTLKSVADLVLKEASGQAVAYFLKDLAEAVRRSRRGTK